MKTASLVIHAQTARSLSNFMRQPAHALIIAGPAGSGKDTLATHLASQLLPLNGQHITDYPHFKILEPEKDKSSIGIEAIRELQQFVKLKLPGQGVRRVILIRQANDLTTEAQNAMLKLLEEPPEDTLLLLAADYQQSLLSTIRSRSQTLVINRPERQALVDYFEQQGYSQADISHAYLLSGGLPGLLSALLAQSDHPLKESVTTAKQLLGMSQFERLALVDSLSKDKPAAQRLLLVLQHMAQAALEQSADKALASGNDASKSLRQWSRVLRASYDTQQAYSASAQAKLALTKLMLAF